MRLLHTSDWHLGRSFHGASLLEEQDPAIERIAELADNHAVDAVLIAGDLYDRAIPPAEAVELFNKALAQLSRDGTAVVAIAGNQDSHLLVSVYDPLLSAFEATICGDVGRAWAPVLVANLLAQLDGRPLAAHYDGYTACPLITSFNSVVMAEFDYDLRRSAPSWWIPPRSDGACSWWKRGCSRGCTGTG